MKFELPKLDYAFDALEPHIDKVTMEIHYGKHHQAYITNLNTALENTDHANKSLDTLLAQVSTLTPAIRNNGGGHYNHSLFWKLLSPKGGGLPTGKLAEAINETFGSLDALKEKIHQAGITRFGSGWAWLVLQNDKLIVSSTPNQDNPLMDVAEIKGTPILGIDVWEHAYYLKYQNRRADYLNAFWNVINWDFVASKI